MAPEHKFATAAKLCSEVLGGVADGALPLSACEEVLGDALRCLACREIKVRSSRAVMLSCPAERLQGILSIELRCLACCGTQVRSPELTNPLSMMAGLL